MILNATRGSPTSSKFDKPFIEKKDSFHEIDSPKLPKEGSYSHMMRELSKVIA